MSAEETKQQLLYQPNVFHNANALSTVKWLSTSFAGSVAGVLGLTNHWGFVLFLLSVLLTTAGVFVVQCKGSSPSRYFPGGWWEILNPGQENIFSFILFWTLFYGIVHGDELTCDLWLLVDDFSVYD